MTPLNRLNRLQASQAPLRVVCYKALKKLRLGKAAFALAAPFCRAKEEMTAAQAETILRGVYAPKRSACIRETPRTWGAPEYDLSILLPTYNNAAYITESVQSALAQETEYSFELIVVNDGSTDDTAKRLLSFADRPNVTVIHQPNGGVSAARNTAIDRAKGRYLLFLDGDDTLIPGAVQALMHAAVANGAAIAEGGYQTVTPSGEALETIAHKEGALDVLKDLYGYPCFKVISRALWRQIDFPPRMYYEDSVLAQLMWEKAALDHETAYGVAAPVGCYRVHPNGFSAASKARPCCVDTVWITKTLMQDRKRAGLAYSQYYYEHLLDMAALSWSRTEYMPKQVRRAVFTLYCAFLNEADRATTQPRQQRLEQAMRTRNFGLFELLCALC